uniref:WAS/WASL-interacting protein family member 2-like n=1 Tax=Gasterosteus aculeatus aculeatus TaxID=481459 RepID=UPI001A99B5D1|nr:WAS/WASL-interacting protein family member 2-like [Gasterosteus aculeatus aculeatus]
MPVPPAPPRGPPAPPTFSQANTTPPKAEPEGIGRRRCPAEDSPKEVEQQEANASSGQSPSSRVAAARHRHEDPESPSIQTLLPTETSCSDCPSLSKLSSAASSPSTSTTHSSPGPPPPPPPPPPNFIPYLREGKTPACSSLAPPPPPYRITNGPTGGVAAADLPQRHNSLGNKRPAPSPGGHTPTRGPAPPPPPASPTPSHQAANRPPPPVRETPCRGAAPPVPVQASSFRPGGRDAPPPYRSHGSPSLCSDPPARGKPPPPPTRTPAGPPPPPPPLRNGHSSVPRSFVDDFESKYSFHPLDDFPPPDEYRHFAKIYPSKAHRVMRGAPPLPPVGR